MPRFPDLFSPLPENRRGPYSQLANRAKQTGGPFFPLHIGDTWMEPAIGTRMEDLSVDEVPGMHQYAPVRGRPSLVASIADRSRLSGDHPAEIDEILVTAGATGGLYALMATLCSPGDEVLVLAPYWPLIANAIQCAGAHVVPVPFFDSAHDPASAVAAFEALRTDRTVAVYWNTPHNPTGRLIPGDWLDGLATWAQRHQLWIVSDEVYEHYAYTASHAYTRPFAPSQTISAYSFSKAYGMAGNRCGYLIGPSSVIRAVQQITRNSFYSVTTASQIAAERALGGLGDPWAADAAVHYRRLGQYAADTLGVAPPEGSTFLFIDVRDALDDAGLPGFLAACADRGLLVAPGTSFGPYPTHIRVCFTSAHPELVRGGIDALAAELTSRRVAR
ncbi:MAG: pyridoxal phosphate-dependent aminotransferase [Myxococcota bacterium]|nr:pyridoxal phosphate-dependent aminotransferase [Myxococcota bacterium]